MGTFQGQEKEFLFKILSFNPLGWKKQGVFLAVSNTERLPYYIM